MQNEHEDHLKNHLISQGSFFSDTIETIFNFTSRYVNNSLPIRKILLNRACHPLPIVRSAYCLKLSMLFQVAKLT